MHCLFGSELLPKEASLIDYLVDFGAAYDLYNIIIKFMNDDEHKLRTFLETQLDG